MQFTQRMTTHINGGRKFSLLAYAVLADGKETNITRTVETNGSPRYLKTADVFRCGEEEFDVLKTNGVGLIKWLESKVNEQPKQA